MPTTSPPTPHTGTSHDLSVGHVVAVRDNLLTVNVTSGPMMKNEVAYVCLGDLRLKAEVLRIQGTSADLQVFEETAGVQVGDRVELTSELLSVTLGPGLLGQVFDGLQQPLSELARQYGFFLPRGITLDPLDRSKKWPVTAVAAPGDRVAPGGVLATVPEGPFEHKILVPFNEPEAVEVTWIRSGNLTLDEPLARLRGADGREREIGLTQRWPVRKPIPAGLLQRRHAERLYPNEPLITTIRLVDTFFPIARGGTACIPGPFGAGKTVLQSLFSRYSSADIVIVVACGERAGEVVETITEFPEMQDPRTGGSLMDRTIIICNTSSMPVAARESSIYTGITLGEYYRQMGYSVLVLADSTSRWAQAMREISGRMEEIPGEEAYPAYLDSSIRNIYERAGVIQCADGSVGSLTLVGTVSPAGGNFEEPVTQATLSTVKTFLGLSSDRAYKRYYPAIDPLLSWSRYLDQLAHWYKDNLDDTWVADVKELSELLRRGDSIHQMMQVTGEEGITLDDYVVWQKATLLDLVYLQQDAFDDIDVSNTLDRQKDSFHLLRDLIRRSYNFADKDQARNYFTRLTGLYKNLNYSADGGPEHQRYKQQITDLAAQYS